MESELFGVSMEIWYSVAGMVSGYHLGGHSMKMKQRIAAIKAETKVLTGIVREKPVSRELPPESSESPEVVLASSGCELTDQILQAAWDKGINPGEFLDGKAA